MMTPSIEAVAQIYSQSAKLGTDGPAAVEDTSAVATDFGAAMSNAATRAVDTVAEAERMSIAAAQGKASVKDTVHAIVEAEMTTHAIVSVRNKLVEAYQELMRMPI